jgi:hypothetical protein
MSPDDMTVLDGSAAAGALSEVFAVDVTSASGRCVGCGRTGPLAHASAYTQAPGLVLRCPSCDGVLLRLVAGPDRTWIDLRGLTYLELPNPVRAARS